MQRNPYRERLRILLILYFFSESYEEATDTRLAKIFRSEVKIQKIDFLIRYPSYLCYEILKLHDQNGVPNFEETKTLISDIFKNEEPTLRTDEMRRFFYGAYEELDSIMSFLISVDLVRFRKQKNVSLKDIKKEYFITHTAIDKIENGLKQIPAAKWYFERCSTIKNYFGDLAGSSIKERQYEIEVYRDTPLGNYIGDIENQVRERYQQLFNLAL